jgi:hypothetical protein
MADEEKPKKKGKKADAAPDAKPGKAERVEKSEQKSERQAKGGKGKGENKGESKRPERAHTDAPPVPPVVVENYIPRMLETYRASVAPDLQKRFSYKSAMQVPRLVKITLNVGLGEATQNPKLLDAAAAEIAALTGQKPIIQKAKKAIANFRLRENQRIGVTVTLRRQGVACRIVDQAATALTAEVQRINHDASRRGGRLRHVFRQKEDVPPIEVPSGGWEIYIQADQDHELARGSLGIVSKLTMPAPPEYGGTPTIRMVKTVFTEGRRASLTSDTHGGRASFEADEVGFGFGDDHHDVGDRDLCCALQPGRRHQLQRSA